MKLTRITRKYPLNDSHQLEINVCQQVRKEESESIFISSTKKTVIGGISENNSPILLGKTNSSFNLYGKKRFNPGDDCSLVLQNKSVSMIPSLFEDISKLSNETDTDGIFVIEITRMIDILPIYDILREIYKKDDLKQNMLLFVIISLEMQENFHYTELEVKSFQLLSKSSSQKIFIIKRREYLGIALQKKYGVCCPPPPESNTLIITSSPNHLTINNMFQLIEGTTDDITVSRRKEVPTVIRMKDGDIVYSITSKTEILEGELIESENEIVAEMKRLISELLILLVGTDVDKSDKLKSMLYLKYLEVGKFNEVNNTKLKEFVLTCCDPDYLTLIVFVLNKMLEKITNIVRKILVNITSSTGVSRKQKKQRIQVPQTCIIPRSYTANNPHEFAYGSTSFYGDTGQQLYPGANNCLDDF